MEAIISIILLLIGIYLLLGVAFSIFFLWKGIEKVDVGTQGSGIIFRLLLFPGMCFFWILFLSKWLKSNRS